ncbi:hypothetical protein SAMN05421548_102282 [Paraburkholderia lycopersici]|uniref:Uncharacterized protein n=1 Tax=Paraburkholderia lycopersici TaxID=416944 RepID=A0A1G6HGG2_9BURK|nr:hypothetical protein SAMN05421548_102282 [Paraburkholderia lycopersici]
MIDAVVGPGTVPDMADRPQIATRHPDNTIGAETNLFAFGGWIGYLVIYTPR